MLEIISIFLNWLRLVLCPSMWSVLENIPRALEKNVYSDFSGFNVLKMSIKSSCSTAPFCIPSRPEWGSRCSVSSPVFGVLRHLDFSCSDRCMVISHCCFVVVVWGCLVAVVLFSFGFEHSSSMWKFLGPGIKPLPPQWSKPLQSDPYTTVPQQERLPTNFRISSLTAIK